MNKIKTYFVAVAVGILSQVMLAVFPLQTASAAAAECFIGTGETFKSASCSSAVGSTLSYRNSANAVIPAAEPDRCYQENNAAPGIRIFIEGDCAGLRAIARQVIVNLCTNSGGEWATVDVLGGGAQGCSCPTANPYSSSTRKCDGVDADTAGQPEQPADADPTRLASRPDDCSEDNLDGTNCGIISYLNLFMNFVSGGIAIAVIGNIIYAGIQYSSAQGDPGNVGKAKTRIQNALIAFIMYICLFAFLQWLIPGGVF